MPPIKIYKCCICHKIFEGEERPIRLVKQKRYGIDYTKPYKNIHNYDFCKECYKRFNSWVKKYEVE